MHIHTAACKLAFKLFSCNLETCRDRFSRTFFSHFSRFATRVKNPYFSHFVNFFFSGTEGITIYNFNGTQMSRLTYVDFTVVLPRKIFFCCTSANSCVTELEDKTKSDHDQNGDIRHDPASTSSSSSPSKKWRQD